MINPLFRIWLAEDSQTWFGNISLFVQDKIETICTEKDLLTETHSLNLDLWSNIFSLSCLSE